MKQQYFTNEYVIWLLKLEIYSIFENFRIAQYSRNFAVGLGKQKLKSAKYFQVCPKKQRYSPNIQR